MERFRNVTELNHLAHKNTLVACAAHVEDHLYSGAHSFSVAPMMDGKARYAKTNKYGPTAMTDPRCHTGVIPTRRH
jgi:hypothetical protein